MAFRIQPITSNALQTTTLILQDGSTLILQLNYIPMQYGWFLTNIQNNSFQLQGIRIVNNPNLLNQWKNLITFGLACFSSSQREPTQQQDFSSGSSSLYLLTQAEVEQYSEILSNG